MSVVTEFTPVQSAIGGALIGASAALLLIGSGRIAGISRIVARIVRWDADSQAAQAIAFITGLALASLVWPVISGQVIAQSVTGNIPLAAASGLLVGFGAGYGSGCTSGHGVCGLSRFSVRSLVAVATFMTAAALTVYVTRHVLGLG